MEICFSPAGIAIIGTMLTALTGAIGLLWRDQTTTRDRHIQYLSDNLAAADAKEERLNNALREALMTGQGFAEIARTEVDRRPPSRGR